MSQIVDTDRLIRLGARTDPAIRTIIQRFFELAEGRIQSLSSAAEEGNLDTLKSQLHQFKGSASTCGFVALEALCRQWEERPSSFDAATLRATLETSLQAWKSFIDHHPL